MEKRRFEIFEILNDSWVIFKESMGTIIVGWVIASAVMMALALSAIPFDLIGTFMMANAKVKAVGTDSALFLTGMIFAITAIALRIINAFISVWMTGGMAYFFTKAAKKEELFFRNLFVFDKRVLHLFIVSILMGLGIVLGLILLIVPGIILMLMWSQAIYLVMNKDMSAIKALGISRELMKGNKFHLFVLWLLVGVIVLGGSLFTCGIGIFFLGPWSTLVYARVYTVLSAEPPPSVPM